MKPNRTSSSGETANRRCVSTSKEPLEGDIPKERQLPMETSETSGSQNTKGLSTPPAIQADSTYKRDTGHSYSDNSTHDNSIAAETETTELGHNDDIMNRKQRLSETFIHPVTSVFVYMKSATGGAPYVCEDCDYKTTVNYMFLDHMNLHYTYSDSDDSE